ncbi:MAG: purine-nucleoside phosphorylase [Anaerolineae bacterium]|nr:purine-nucleoside phosphorylase [Anaerolineae bacterium]
MMQEITFIPENHYREAADFIEQRTDKAPTTGLILGSGLGSLVEEIQDADIISTTSIPHWPQSTVLGHEGRIVIGHLGKNTVLVLQGRVHFYEGYSMAQVTLPIRVMKLLGINTVILTNAAGGLDPDYKAGDIMVIEDHIFPPGLAGHNPLCGPNLGMFGPRFPSAIQTYNPVLRKLAHQIAEKNGFTMREGVYVSLSGPAFETPAEVRMLRAWGGNAVGMSTAPEALVAYHTGMRVLGFSSITNKSIDNTAHYEEITHEEVLKLGRQIVPRLTAVIRGVLDTAPPYDPETSENHPENG